MAHHVFAHARFADLDTEFQQFTMDLRSAPDWIFAAHGANQLATFFRHLRTARLASSNLPGPEQPKAVPMPSDDRGGFRDVGPRPPSCQPCQTCQIHGMIEDTRRVHSHLPLSK